MRKSTNEPVLYPVKSLGPEEAPFDPHWIHRYFRWVEQLPVPHWLYYLGWFLFFAIMQHAVAWSGDLLAAGSLNLYLTFSSIWLVETLYFGYQFERAGRAMLEQIWPLINKIEEESFDQLNYRFNWIPKRIGNVLFFAGFAAGMLLGWGVRESMPAVNYAFPPLNYLLWALPNAVAAIFIYRIIRQLRMLQKIVGRISSVNLLHLNPLNAVSRFTGFIAIAVLIIVYLNNFLITPEAVYQPSIIIVMVVNAAVAIGIFLLPLRELIQIIEDEKDRRLDLISERLESTYHQLHSSVEANDWRAMDQKKNAAEALLAERKTIQSVSTLPWRPRMLTGLVSTILLPVLISLLQQWLLARLGM